MTIFYECSVKTDKNEFNLLGSEHAGFVRRYKSPKTFFQYFMTDERINWHARNIRNSLELKESDIVTMKIYSVSGNIFDETCYRLLKNINL